MGDIIFTRSSFAAYGEALVTHCCLEHANRSKFVTGPGIAMSGDNQFLTITVCVSSGLGIFLDGTEIPNGLVYDVFEKSFQIPKQMLHSCSVTEFFITKIAFKCIVVVLERESSFSESRSTLLTPSIIHKIFDLLPFSFSCKKKDQRQMT